MDDKPLDLSKRSASPSTESQLLSTEEWQESAVDLRLTRNRSVSYDERKISKSVEHGERLIEKDGTKSRLSSNTRLRHSIPKRGGNIPGRCVTDRRKMSNEPASNSVEKHKSFDSTPDAKKNIPKATSVFDPNYSEKASEKCISPRSSTSAGVSCSNVSEEIRGHVTKSDDKSTFNCEYCGKNCRNKSAYEIHVRSHTGEKPYRCEQCGKTFSRKENRNAHTYIHTEYGRFVCQECNKVFNFQSRFREHIIIHIGGKSFKCDVCNKSFFYKKNMTRHKKIHAKKPKEAKF